MERAARARHPRRSVRFSGAEPIAFEGWTIERESDGVVHVRRGSQHGSAEWPSQVLARSDEAGTFLDVDSDLAYPCGHQQVPSILQREAALLAGACALLWLFAIGVAAQWRLHARRTVRPESSPTYRRTGRPTIDDVSLWRAVERDAREVVVAVLGSLVLVVTWALVFAGVL